MRGAKGSAVPANTAELRGEAGVEDEAAQLMFIHRET